MSGSELEVAAAKRRKGAIARLVRWHNSNLSPSARRRWEEIEALWRKLGDIPRPAMPSAAELAADRYDGSVPVAEWLSRQASEQTTVRADES